MLRAFLQEGVGDAFTGTSNVHIAMEIGARRSAPTPMNCRWSMRCWPATTRKKVRDARYTVLESWSDTYSGNLLVMLPDTYGTTEFLRDAPDWVASWTGRPDSGPDRGRRRTDRLVEVARQGPEDKLLVFSDAMDIDPSRRVSGTSTARCASATAEA